MRTVPLNFYDRRRMSPLATRRRKLNALLPSKGARSNTRSLFGIGCNRVSIPNSDSVRGPISEVRLRAATSHGGWGDGERRGGFGVWHSTDDDMLNAWSGVGAGRARGAPAPARGPSLPAAEGSSLTRMFTVFAEGSSLLCSLFNFRVTKHHISAIYRHTCRIARISKLKASSPTWQQMMLSLLSRIRPPLILYVCMQVLSGTAACLVGAGKQQPPARGFWFWRRTLLHAHHPTQHDEN